MIFFFFFFCMAAVCIQYTAFHDKSYPLVTRRTVGDRFWSLPDSCAALHSTRQLRVWWAGPADSETSQHTSSPTSGPRVVQCAAEVHSADDDSRACGGRGPPSNFAPAPVRFGTGLRTNAKPGPWIESNSHRSHSNRRWMPQ